MSRAFAIKIIRWDNCCWWKSPATVETILYAWNGLYEWWRWTCWDHRSRWPWQLSNSISSKWVNWIKKWTWATSSLTNLFFFFCCWYKDNEHDKKSVCHAKENSYLNTNTWAKERKKERKKDIHEKERERIRVYFLLLVDRDGGDSSSDDDVSRSFFVFDEDFLAVFCKINRNEFVWINENRWQTGCFLTDSFNAAHWSNDLSYCFFSSW